MAIIFEPFFGWPILAGLFSLVVVFGLLAVWRGLSGWVWRVCAGIGLVLALSNPVVRQADLEPLSDIVVLVVDETASQSLGQRANQTAQARADIEAQIAQMPNTELRVVTLIDSTDNRGSLLLTKVSEAMAQEPRARLAGVITITDGRLHDAHLTPELPAPLHVLLTGQPMDWDRRLIVRNAPAFGILDEEISFTLEIEDQGRVPTNLEAVSALLVSIDGGDPITLSLPVGREVNVPLTLRHGGINTLHFTIPSLAGELTDQNNQAVVQINGVRDRLRVLLVSGEPHNGERTWRNILTSDAAVDMVHFTILRPSDKQDGVPITELALIAFPTRELFMDKIDDFDLIIFDRYKLRGILPALYLDNIARYAENGGAILISAGPDFAGANSLYRSPMSRVIPVEPTGRVYEEGYRPQVSDVGRRHPVTRGLDEGYVAADSSQSEEARVPKWGRWFRQVDLEATSGETVMSGVDGQPLLVLDHVGTGRVAVLASDNAWLWARGVEGGGPQSELLRRLAHWMMKEPDLEEELLSGVGIGEELHITRRTLSETPPRVKVIGPDGSERTVDLQRRAAGVFSATLPVLAQGVYRLQDLGEQEGKALEAVTIIGPASQREYEQTIAAGETLRSLTQQRRGGVLSLSGGVPDVRRVSEGRPAAGRGWIGITPREANATLSQSTQPLLPTWVWALLLGGFALAAWVREGRR